MDSDIDLDTDTFEFSSALSSPDTTYTQIKPEPEPSVFQMSRIEHVHPSTKMQFLIKSRKNIEANLEHTTDQSHSKFSVTDPSESNPSRSLKPSIVNSCSRLTSVLKSKHTYIAKVQPSPKFRLLLIPKPQSSSSTPTLTNSSSVELPPSPTVTVPDTTISSEIFSVEDAQLSESSCKQGIPAFPFPLLSMSCYHHRGQLAAANDARNEDRVNKRPIKANGEMIALQRSKVNGTIAENIATLKTKFITSNKRHKVELKWMIQVGEYIQNSGILLPTLEVIDYYTKLNEKDGIVTKAKHVMPADFYYTVCKHLNVSQIYI